MNNDETMRLDVFLSRVRLIMPRTSAKRACDNGIVTVNNRPAKPSTDIGIGDVISVRFTNQDLMVQVTRLPGKSVAKKQADTHFTVIENRANANHQGNECAD